MDFGIPKCVVVVLSYKCNLNTYSLSSRWLSVNLAPWADFHIIRFALYSGFYIGPSAGASSWTKAVLKSRSRVRSIAASGLGGKIGAFKYSQVGLPVLGYLGQFLPLPKKFPEIERHGIHHMLHLPTNALDRDACFNLPLPRGRCFPSVSAYTLACSARAAAKTCKTLIFWKL